MIDVLASIFLIGGSILALTAGIGLMRFPNLMSRMHAATKPQTLGLLIILTGVALELRETAAIAMLLLVALFQLLTAPVSAHMVGRAAFRTQMFDDADLVVDEMTDAQRRAEQAEE